MREGRRESGCSLNVIYEIDYALIDLVLAACSQESKISTPLQISENSSGVSVVEIQCPPTSVR
jgi:hypothetical protein